MRSSSGRNGRRLVGRADRDEPRHVVGHLDPGEVRRPAVGVAHHHGEVQRQPADVGERVRRVDRQRGEHREDLVAEVLAQPLALVVGRGRPSARSGCPRSSSRGRDVLDEARRRAAGTRSWVRSVISSSCSRMVSPSGAAHRQAGALPALQPGDPHHVELVEVAGEDRQELHPLQQRQRVVLGELQHPRVEVQPGQLPVEEPVGRQRTGPGRALGGHGVIVPHPGERRVRPAEQRPSSAVVRGPAPSASAARRSASVSTSRTRPGQSPASGDRAAGPVRRRRARAEARGAAATPTAVSSVVPVPCGVGDEARGGRRPRPRSAAASSAGRSAGRSEESAATAGPASAARAVLEGGVQPARPARRRPCARRARGPRSAAAGSSVTTTTSATTGQASAAATVSASRASTRSSWRVPAAAGRSAAAAGSWRRRAASPGRRPTSCARTHVSTSGATAPDPPVRVGGGVEGRSWAGSHAATDSGRWEGGPWPRRRPRTAGDAAGPPPAEVAHPRPAAATACCVAIVVVYPVASLMFRLRYRHAERLPAARAGAAGRQPRLDPRPARLRPAGVRHRPAAALPGQAVGVQGRSPARCCAAPGRSRSPGSRPTRTPRSTRPRPTSTPATSS